MRSLGRWVNAVTASAALAMASAGGVAAGGCVHTGAGVARRAAYHERRAEDRAHLQEVNVEKLLANESRDDVVVRVAADSIVLDTEGPNYGHGEETVIGHTVDKQGREDTVKTR